MVCVDVARMCDTRCGGRPRTVVRVWSDYRYEAGIGRFVLQGSIDYVFALERRDAAIAVARPTKAI